MTFYGFSKAIIRAAGRTIWRTAVSGEGNVPSSGAVIVAANHLSYLDPPLLGAFCPRRLSYMAKRELFAVPLLGPTIRALGAYPVDREGNAAGAIKRALEVLRSGNAVGIFPEGTRSRPGTVHARRGVALLAAFADAPVVPAALVGTDQAVRLGRIRIAYGTPLRLAGGRKATREEMAKFTDDVMSAVRALVESIGGDS